MRISSVARLWLFAAPLFVLAGAAVAQSQSPTQPAAPNDSNLSFAGVIAKQPAKPKAPDVPAPPSAWPRLEPGAVICRSEDDLLHRAALLRGEPAGPADCRPITVPTAIQIVHRAGPGRTEIKVTAHDETGWTDAWLPGTPPPGRTPTPPPQPAGGSTAGSQ
jgi:hypothetical protein